MDDLIAIPVYGWLYRVYLECGHRVLTSEPQPLYDCRECGYKMTLYPTWETVRRA